MQDTHLIVMNSERLIPPSSSYSHTQIPELHVIAIAVSANAPASIVINTLQHTATHCNTLQHAAIHHASYTRRFRHYILQPLTQAQMRLPASQRHGLNQSAGCFLNLFHYTYTRSQAPFQKHTHVKTHTQNTHAHCISTHMHTHTHTQTAHRHTHAHSTHEQT